MRFEHAARNPKPERVTLERGTYFFCRCGKTMNPPHCDGRHARTGITPLRFLTDGETEMALCTCGLTEKPPHCDGSHKHF
jgi:CDGSH-type Zn-finger protein